MQACKAWHAREMEGWSWADIQDSLRTPEGDRPGRHAVENAVRRVAQSTGEELPGQTNYGNCGRKKALSPSQVKAAVAFVRRWRHKRFCTCRYIIQELRLPVTKRTLARTLNANGFFWRPVPKQACLSAKDIARRKAWVDAHLGKTARWWQQNMNLVLDGVTLTMPPKTLNGRQKHAAQRIGHMWLRHGEKADPRIHTFNRYGVQLGTKVALWGGFTGGGHFTLRLWTPRPKMTKDEWQRLVPKLKRAVDDAEARAPERRTRRAKVWQDNERFLCCPGVYRKNGLQMFRFPPNSGDLNPIETVWALLRQRLAEREQEDLTAGRALTLAQFKQRAAQILQAMGTPGEGESKSYLEKLVCGMPSRLAKAKANNYGRCGK